MTREEGFKDISMQTHLHYRNKTVNTGDLCFVVFDDIAGVVHSSCALRISKSFVEKIQRVKEREKAFSFLSYHCHTAALRHSNCDYTVHLCRANPSPKSNPKPNAVERAQP